MAKFLDAREKNSIPILAFRKEAFADWVVRQGEPVRGWIAATGFEPEAGKSCLVPGADGRIGEVLLGLGPSASPWDWAALPADLPARGYHADESLSPEDADAAALGWALGSYRFDRLRASKGKEQAALAWPERSRRDRVEAAASATLLVRDLINTPASDMGPADLANAAEGLARDHGASVRVVVGEDLLRRGYPAVHAVGRAAAPERAPRLIDIIWGDEKSPKVTLVGKGVCFDSGGLDLKPAANMKLMKKDMGGGAQALGLASMIMKTGLRVRLRALVPAVENSVSGSALRPLDVVRTRKGTTVEIGNTDAEGRVILADALADAAEEKPDLLVDFATLTGAARVALGTELPALFSNDDELAASLSKKGETEHDPLWRMPLHQPYRKLIESKVADITNAADTPFAGCITAALFLEEFVGQGIPWVHIDFMGWNVSSRPGRPEGGEAMGMRAVYALLEERFPK